MVLRRTAPSFVRDHGSMCFRDFQKVYSNVHFTFGVVLRYCRESWVLESGFIRRHKEVRPLVNVLFGVLSLLRSVPWGFHLFPTGWSTVASQMKAVLPWLQLWDQTPCQTWESYIWTKMNLETKDWRCCLISWKIQTANWSHCSELLFYCIFINTCQPTAVP